MREVVVAFVALREGRTASTEDLVMFSRQHLAEYKCPERIVFLAVLPKGPTGKVQRRALKEFQAEAPVGQVPDLPAVRSDCGRSPPLCC